MAATTGLVLSGGQGRRVGGRDKGLMPWHGAPVAAVVAARLGPQVATVAISANRHLDTYRALGHAVWPDDDDLCEPGGGGPLAGLITALRRTPTPWLLTAPCDAPGLPADLGARLRHALHAADADAAWPVTADADGATRPHPTCALLRRDAALPVLQAYHAGGGRRLRQALAALRHAEPRFDDASAFANLNTPADWAAAS